MGKGHVKLKLYLIILKYDLYQRMIQQTKSLKYYTHFKIRFFMELFMRIKLASLTLECYKV
jgi:hypothetical protein